MAGKIRYTEEEVLKQMQDHYKRHEKMTRKFFGEDKTVCWGSTCEGTTRGKLKKIRQYP